MKVWVVVAEDYGTSRSSVIHICETKEVAESFRDREHKLDYAGPIYKVKEVKVHKKLAVLPEDLW